MIGCRGWGGRRGHDQPKSQHEPAPGRERSHWGPTPAPATPSDAEGPPADPGERRRRSEHRGRREKPPSSTTPSPRGRERARGAREGGRVRVVRPAVSTNDRRVPTEGGQGRTQKAAREKKTHRARQQSLATRVWENEVNQSG